MKINTLGAFGLLFVAIASTSAGWFYVSYAGGTLSYSFGVRAASLVFSLFVAFVVAILVARKGWGLPRYFYIFIIYFIYLCFVSLLRGGGEAMVSPAIRITVLLFVFIAARSLLYVDLQRIFFWASCYFLVEAAYAYLIADAGLFLNGMWRLGGPVGSASGYAALFFFINVGSLLYSGRGDKRWSYLSFIALIPLYLTGSRSTFAAAFLVSLAVFLLRRGVLGGVIWSWLMVAVGVIAVSFVDVLGDQHRLTSLADGELDNSSLYRIFILNTYIQNVSDHEFLFGLGLNGFPAWFERYTGDVGVAPHFEPLTVLVEGGVFGVTIYSVASLVFMRAALRSRGYRAMRSDEKFAAVIVWTAPLFAFAFLNPFYFLGPMILWVILSASILAGD